MCCLGYGTQSQHRVICSGWKEWNPEDEGRLKYEYRIRAFGTSQSYLFYFGYNMESPAVVFPIGNWKYDFVNQAVIYIVDSIGDYCQMEQNVTVRWY